MKYSRHDKARVLRIFYAWDNDNKEKQLFSSFDMFLGIMQLKPYRKTIRANYINKEALDRGEYYVDNKIKTPRIFVRLDLLAKFLEDNQYWRNYTGKQKLICATLNAILEYDQDTYLENADLLKAKKVRIVVPEKYFLEKPKEEEIYNG